MYYKTSKIKNINKGVLSFYKDFNTLKEAGKYQITSLSGLSFH
jgi:hypothetical protein